MKPIDVVNSLICLATGIIGFLIALKVWGII